MIPEAIAIGLVLSLIFSETLGLATGGMIVPGYVALHMHQPIRVLATVVISLATLGAIRFLSNYAFIYGRRRTVILLLTGFLLGQISHRLFRTQIFGSILDFAPIGYIIPGLIADWMERQGVVETLASMAIAATLVRMFMILFSGGTVIF